MSRRGSSPNAGGALKRMKMTASELAASGRQTGVGDPHHTIRAGYLIRVGTGRRLARGGEPPALYFRNRFSCSGARTRGAGKVRNRYRYRYRLLQINNFDTDSDTDSDLLRCSFLFSRQQGQPQHSRIVEQVENQLTVGICLSESGNSGLGEDLMLGHVCDFLGDIGVPDPRLRGLGIQGLRLDHSDRRL